MKSPGISGICSQYVFNCAPLPIIDDFLPGWFSNNDEPVVLLVSLLVGTAFCFFPITSPSFLCQADASLWLGFEPGETFGVALWGLPPSQWRQLGSGLPCYLLKSTGCPHDGALVHIHSTLGCLMPATLNLSQCFENTSYFTSCCFVHRNLSLA